ncbi:MAG: adenosylcobinamide-GDP ribazoletransferase [Gemmatimonadaceae bacterium]
MSSTNDSPPTQQLRAIVAAFTFLTRLPVGGLVAHDLSDLSRSATYFPVVGLVVGALSAATFAAAQLLWSPLVALVLAIVATVLITGAFHEDALADSLDGFGGGWSKQQVLSIMKDSRVGSYALIGVVLVTFAKVATLLSIYENAQNLYSAKRSGLGASAIWTVARALVVAHVAARWSSVSLIRTHPYVRAEESGVKLAVGRPFVHATTNSQLIGATGISFAIVIPLLQSQFVWVCLAAIIVTMLAGRYFTRRIGGITGDALGATNQCVELAVYLVLAARPLAVLAS